MHKYRVPRHELAQPLDASYRLIPLTNGLNAVVDAADFEWISRWNWRAQPNETKHGFYAVRTTGKEEGLPHILRMHVAVFRGTCDHRNRNGLDNRRHNLRAATEAQQKMNASLRKDSTSGYKGVSFRKRDGNWRAYIKKEGRFIHLGGFSSKQEAARAYDAAALKLFGEFAALNFPENGMIHA